MLEINMAGKDKDFSYRQIGGDKNLRNGAMRCLHCGMQEYFYRVLFAAVKRRSE